MYAVRHRVVLLFTYACLVGMLTGPVHAQVKGRGLTLAPKRLSRCYSVTARSDNRQCQKRGPDGRGQWSNPGRAKQR